MIVRELEKLVQGILQELQIPEGGKVVFEHPKDIKHGDYSTNIAMSEFRRFAFATEAHVGQINWRREWSNPVALAQKIVAEIKAKKPSYISRVEVVSPGFINFFLDQEYFLEELKEILKQKAKYGSGKEKKTVVIDYSSPNIAKSFGIGHLRSTIIGQALYNLYRFLGYKTIGDNHLGDWGTQFGALLCQIKKEGLGERELSVEELEKLYVKFHQSPDEEGARAWFKSLEDGDKEARRIWEKVRKTSLREFERIYKLLEVKIDNALGESFYEPMLNEIVAEVKKKGLAKRSRGALIVEFPQNKLPPAILLKSDETTNYFTRDLATVKYRLKKWKPDKMVYEVGAEQALHLKQVFWAAELLGWAQKERFKHVAHGLYRTKQGKFSTRKGQTIRLEDVLEDAISRAREIIEQSETARGLSVKEKEEVARAVGIGAVKYNDLMQHPSGDIVFDWNKILNLKGNSVPYLQYTYARCKSILRQAKRRQTKFSKLSLAKEEMSLLRLLYRFPEVVYEAGENFSPNLVAAFAFDIAQAYNNFYNTHRVLQAETEAAGQFRLLLTATTAQILQNSLHLLGIKTLERM